ncbi:MAG: CDP-diacylglycerol--glycerol-3-phosphate 3-phosphatidyltransferase [Candidatus Omnitrophica bacterium]|nr:CDP-diacylglycerol--glycerol-3-phosphate 3-phosphatidyltransferase [Candidatus Omnitrophota bacterium]
MNLPNKLTISRIILTFLFMFFLFSKGILMKFFALVTFLTASATDYYDGKIARERNETTDFGRFMDPIADKFLTIAAFLVFVEMGLVPAWMVALIISRELIITGLRLFASTKGRVLQAEAAGKHKTVSQITAITVILVFIFLRDAGMKLFSIWSNSLEYWFRQVIFILMIITVALTLISGLSYLWKNRRLFLNAKENH